MYIVYPVFFVLQSSLESELLQCDGQLTGFVSLCKEILQRFVREHFPTTSVSTAATQVTLYEYYICTLQLRFYDMLAAMNPRTWICTNVSSMYVHSLQQVPIQDLWCVAAKDMLLEYIAKMQLPNRYVGDKHVFMHWWDSNTHVM